ncbi:MAG: type II toxin-antitoxin system prevent-host-death family antitoxin [Opitutaceae bacterium]|nr:type II toxin-antitoxin system prevent-host-death family antitoxin [Opitutaceae bacterium]
MIKVNTHEAQKRLHALVAAVEEHGETVIICRDGKPVAELRAITSTVLNPLRVHPELAGRILYDPTEPATVIDWSKDAQ